MPHILILGCLSEMAGNATEGGIFDLLTAATALDNKLNEILTPEQEAEIHAMLEEVEAWACTGGTYEMGASAQAEDFTSRCNALL